MNDTEGNDAKAIQDAESSGFADLMVTPFSGVVQSGVKDRVTRTDARAAKTDDLFYIKRIYMYLSTKYMCIFTYSLGWS